MTAPGGDLLAWLGNAISVREAAATAAVDEYGADWYYDDGFVLARHIAANDPASVLRRCAGDRKLLELHRPMDHEGEMAVFCSECDVSGDYPYFPCATLRILAEGYGWSAQTSLAVDQGQTPPIEGDQVT